MANPNLNPNESVVTMYRQTEMVLVRPVIIMLVAIYLPWYFALRFDIAAQYRYLLLIWTVLVAMYGMRHYLMWSLHRYIVTTHRLISLTHEGIFKKLVIETPLERILNVSYKTTGLWSSLLYYGDVEVQVVGLVEPLVLSRIKYPAMVKDYLWQLHQQTVKPYTQDDIMHIQEKAGYTKPNQKIL